MSVRILAAGAAAMALALAVACSSESPAPTAPTNGAVDDGGAAPDGSTLSVTAPGPISPASGAELKTREPVFSVTNAQAKSGPELTLEYRFDIETEAGQLVMNSPKVAAGSGSTKWEVPNFLDQGSYRWRARAEMGTRFGPWTAFVPFQITYPPSLLPAGPYPTSGPDIVRFVQDSYPDRGERRQSLADRKEDMAFLRDRIIEIGLCTGQQMGRNLKRGGPELSVDFLAFKTNGQTWGVDIAGGYDDTSKRLILTWHMHEPRAFFSPLPNPEPCRN
jgi:hypothetical protein